MAPDINSLSSDLSLPSPVLPQSQPRAMSQALNPPNRDTTPSPRPHAHSLAAAASMNAADRRASSNGGQNSPRLDRRSSRRRSQIAMSFSLNDPSIPSPGELSSSDRRSSITNAFSSASPTSLGGRQTVANGDPHHHRQASLGDIHNELEQEQEAQMNRMLQLIRAQQQQLDSMRSQTAGANVNTPQASAPTSTAVIDELTPQSERSFSFQTGNYPHPTSMPRRSRDHSSASRSPALRPRPSQDMSGQSSEWGPPSPLDSSRRSSIRDESAYYQAETANLHRENQMLRLRIRDLEKQLQERQSSPLNSPTATARD